MVKNGLSVAMTKDLIKKSYEMEEDYEEEVNPYEGLSEEGKLKLAFEMEDEDMIYKILGCTQWSACGRCMRCLDVRF